MAKCRDCLLRYGCFATNGAVLTFRLAGFFAGCILAWNGNFGVTSCIHVNKFAGNFCITVGTVNNRVVLTVRFASCLYFIFHFGFATIVRSKRQRNCCGFTLCIAYCAKLYQTVGAFHCTCGLNSVHFHSSLWSVRCSFECFCLSVQFLVANGAVNNDIYGACLEASWLYAVFFNGWFCLVTKSGNCDCLAGDFFVASQAVNNFVVGASSYTSSIHFVFDFNVAIFVTKRWNNDCITVEFFLANCAVNYVVVRAFLFASWSNVVFYNNCAFGVTCCWYYCCCAFKLLVAYGAVNYFVK